MVRLRQLQPIQRLIAVVTRSRRHGEAHGQQVVANREDENDPLRAVAHHIDFEQCPQTADTATEGLSATLSWKKKLSHGSVRLIR